MTEVRRYPDARALGEGLAAEIADGLAAATADGRRYLLGCPGGRSARTTYSALARRLNGADLRPLVIAMMDEYVIPDDNRRRFHAVPEDVHFSRRRFAVREIVGLLNEAAVSGAGIPPEQVWLPDPADPAAYDERLETAGGVDLFILASGAIDGHVAFLPPGSPPDGSTAIVRLAETTRRDNLTTFPGFLSLDDVPTHGVSVGLGTIRRLSRRIRLIIHGEDKQETARRVLQSNAFDSSRPATIVHACADAAILVDRSALAGDTA